MGTRSTRTTDTDGRTRHAQLVRLATEAEAVARSILGEEPRVQIVVVDLVVSQPLLYSAVPLRSPRQPRRLHRDQLLMARGNLDIALAEFNAASERWLSVEDARAAADELSASNVG